MTTWIAACRNTVGPAKFLIPQDIFLVGPVTFAGPCKSFPITLENQGTVKATTDISAYSSSEWFSIEDVTGFILTGSGVFDGQGVSVWTYNDCIKNNLCQLLPIVTIRLPNSIIFPFILNYNCFTLNFFNLCLISISKNLNSLRINIFKNKNLLQLI